MNWVLDQHSVFTAVFPVLFIVVFGALSWALSAWSRKRMTEWNANASSAPRRR